MAQNELSDLFRQIDLHIDRALAGVDHMRRNGHARILPGNRAIHRLGTMLTFALFAFGALMVL